MSLTEIKSAVRDLSPKELAELTAFISEQDNAVWREQMEQDAASGKLDFLFQDADKERQAGKLRDWPEKEWNRNARAVSGSFTTHFRNMFGCGREKVTIFGNAIIGIPRSILRNSRAVPATVSQSE
jgi:hypothetical protein